MDASGYYIELFKLVMMGKTWVSIKFASSAHTLCDEPLHWSVLGASCDHTALFVPHQRQKSFCEHILSTIGSSASEFNCFPCVHNNHVYRIETDSTHTLTVWPESIKQSPKHRIACHRPDTMTKSCTIVGMDTTSECTAYFATRISDTSHDRVNQVEIPIHCMCIYGKSGKWQIVSLNVIDDRGKAKTKEKEDRILSSYTTHTHFNRRMSAIKTTK